MGGGEGDVDLLGKIEICIRSANALQLNSFHLDLDLPVISVWNILFFFTVHKNTQSTHLLSVFLTRYFDFDNRFSDENFCSLTKDFATPPNATDLMRFVQNERYDVLYVNKLSDFYSKIHAQHDFPKGDTNSSKSII